MKRMRTAIRCEHSDGSGMFTSYLPGTETYRRIRPSNYPELRDMFDRHNKFNTPREDGLSRSVSHFCAYKTINQFKEWVWHEELLFLVHLGFRVYKLKLRDCQVGKHNIIFDKQDVVTETDITDQLLKS